MDLYNNRSGQPDKSLGSDAPKILLFPCGGRCLIASTLFFIQFLVFSVLLTTRWQPFQESEIKSNQIIFKKKRKKGKIKLKSNG